MKCFWTGHNIYGQWGKKGTTWLVRIRVSAGIYAETRLYDLEPRTFAQGQLWMNIMDWSKMESRRENEKTRMLTMLCIIFGIFTYQAIERMWSVHRDMYTVWPLHTAHLPCTFLLVHIIWAIVYLLTGCLHWKHMTCSCPKGCHITAIYWVFCFCRPRSTWSI